MSTNVIRNWLKYLDIEEYSDGFIDNGYDDLETVKLIQGEDLDAIGVVREAHQEYILASVKDLREKGAAWVHLLYCNTTEIPDEN